MRTVMGVGGYEWLTDHTQNSYCPKCVLSRWIKSNDTHPQTNITPSHSARGQFALIPASYSNIKIWLLLSRSWADRTYIAPDFDEFEDVTLTDDETEGAAGTELASVTCLNCGAVLEKRGGAKTCSAKCRKALSRKTARVS